MIPALISYILLNIFLARARAKSGTEVDEGRKAEIIAKVERIVNVINCVMAIWFKFVKPLSVEKVAYSESIYGLGAYLVYFKLSNGQMVKVATESRSSWNYSITNNDFGL